MYGSTDILMVLISRGDVSLLLFDSSFDFPAVHCALVKISSIYTY